MSEGDEANFGSDVVEPDVEQTAEPEVPRYLDSYPSFEDGPMCHGPRINPHHSYQGKTPLVRSHDLKMYAE